MASIIPCLSRNSLRWKPSGSFCRSVCSITRGPANPISALGSARITSPWKAKEAATPPVVGSSSTLTYGWRTWRKRASAALHFAICISEKMASCIRAPPEAEKTMAGMRRSVARSKIRVTFSPTTEPIEPPMKPKWKAPIETSRPESRPRPLTNASVSPAPLAVARMRSRSSWFSCPV